MSGGRLDMSFKSLAPAYIHSQPLLSVNSTCSTKDSLHCSNLLKFVPKKQLFIQFKISFFEFTNAVFMLRKFFGIIFVLSISKCSQKVKVSVFRSKFYVEKNDVIGMVSQNL